MSQAQKDRSWIVARGVYEDGTPEGAEDFRARVRAKLIDCEALGDMVGGSFFMRPQRQEVDGEWITVAWHIGWMTEGAARRATGEFERKPEPAPEPLEFVGIGTTADIAEMDEGGGA